MKYAIAFFALLFLYGCANVIYDLELVRPNEIGLSEDLYGKVFSINCEGNDYAKEKTVDNDCRYIISGIAYKKGYSYFTVLDSFRDTKITTGNYLTTTPVNSYYRDSKGNFFTSTTYSPQNNTYSIKHNYSYYIFLLIKEDEIGNWKNYYKVADYYTAEDYEAQNKNVGRIDRRDKSNR
jgi:hypothetical protein